MRLTDVDTMRLSGFKYKLVWHFKLAADMVRGGTSRFEFITLNGCNISNCGYKNSLTFFSTPPIFLLPIFSVVVMKYLSGRCCSFSVLSLCNYWMSVSFWEDVCVCVVTCLRKVFKYYVSKHLYFQASPSSHSIKLVEINPCRPFVNYVISSAGLADC